MCGRFEVNYNNKELDELLKSLPPGSPPVKIGEVFPGNPALTLTLRNQKIITEVMAWGFPRWDKKGVIFNARAESALHKPMFASSLKKRPVVIPVSGFYEWRKIPDSGKKEKFLFTGKHPVLYLAGFWNEFPEEKIPAHFTILTTQANPSMLPYHNRMPVTLEAGEAEPWLKGQSCASILSKEPGPLAAALIQPA